MEQVRMTYTGPGTKPKDMEVNENEVQDLVNTGLWAKSRSKKTVEETQKEEEAKEDSN